MKKVLSLVLALAMIATLFTGAVAMPASAKVVESTDVFAINGYNSDFATSSDDMSIDITSYVEGDGSIKLDFDAKAAAEGTKNEYSYNFGNVLNEEFLKQLDYNVRYFVRASLKGSEDFRGCIYIQTVSHFNNGGRLGNQNRTVNNGEQLLLNAPGSGNWNSVATDWTTYTTTTAITPVGHKMEVILRVRAAGAGTLWIDKLELVPATASSESGYISLKGYDETLQKTVYTARANDGYAIADVLAQDMNQAAVEVTKISSTKSEVEFTTANPSSVMGQYGFLSVKFAINTTPPQDPSESVKIFEFTESNFPRDTGNSWDADKGAFKFDLDDKYAANNAQGEYGLNYTFDIPTEVMDANTSYQIRINYEVSSDLVAFGYFDVRADGGSIRRALHNGEARWTNGHATIPAANTALNSIDSITAFGYTMNATFRFRVKNAAAVNMLASGNTDNAIWFKSIELVPSENNSDAHGYVKVTGYDSDNARAIYTAYPEEGYEIAAISAEVFSGSSNEVINLTSYIVIEETDEYTTFSIDRNKPDGSGEYVKYLLNGNYVSVVFVEGDIVPMLSPDESYLLFDFDTEDQLTPFTHGYIETDPEYVYGGEGGSLAFDGTVSGNYNVYLEADDIAHFDANNRYFVEMEFSAEPTAKAMVYINPFYDFGFASGQISRTHNQNHMDVVGVVGGASVSGDDTFSTYRSTSSIPVVGSRVRLQICVRNTGTGVIQLDNIRLVPEYDRTDAHGYIQSSYNAETNTVDFIATAEEGYYVKELSMTKPALNIDADTAAELGIGTYDNYTWKYDITERLNDNQTLFSLTYDDMFPLEKFIVCDNGNKSFIRAEFLDSAALIGDVNDDFDVNILDLVRFKNHLAGNDVTVDANKADLDADGIIAVGDLVELRKILLGI